MAELADGADEPAGGAVGRPPVRRAAIAALALLLVLVGWLGWRDVELRRAEHLRAAMVQAAREGLLALTTIDHGQVDDDVRRILGHLSRGAARGLPQARGIVQSGGPRGAVEVGRNGDGVGRGVGRRRERTVLVTLAVMTSNRGVPEQRPKAWRTRVSVVRTVAPTRSPRWSSSGDCRPGPDAPRPRRGRGVASSAQRGWLYWDVSQRRAAQRAGTEAVQAARDSIVAILSYRPESAERELQAAADDRLTGQFLQDYSQLIKTVVAPNAMQQGVSAAARVPAAAVISADADRVVVLAYVDQTMTVGTADPPVPTPACGSLWNRSTDAGWCPVSIRFKGDRRWANRVGSTSVHPRFSCAR